MNTVWQRIFLGLGANLGHPRQQLREAADRLLAHPSIRFYAAAALYQTEPAGVMLAQPDFLNTVLALETTLVPRELLQLIQQLEAQAGRVSTGPNHPRPLDIDILLYAAQMVLEKDLVIPHPRMVERAFVMVPLAEIAPDLIHPLLGKNMQVLAERLGQAGIRRKVLGAEWIKTSK